MNSPLLARSARPEFGIGPQPFWDHVREVIRLVSGEDDPPGFATRLAEYCESGAEELRNTVIAAACLHDCGKLAPENQQTLNRVSRERLPIRHEDAGVAWLMELQASDAALLVAAHHGGLPSIPDEKRKLLESPPGDMFRIEDALAHTSRHLAGYKEQYHAANQAVPPRAVPAQPWSGLKRRLALSCLVDADYTDSARHCGSPRPIPMAPRWRERLTRLNDYVSRLAGSRAREPRTAIRQRVYQACRDANVQPSLRSCEAAVGSGKTTAVMAHLLNVAEKRKLRHVFVVLPYTNIIHQSVKVYREALTLPGEDPEQVVAELDHLADYQNEESRSLAALWDAPIVLTTAVQFFETIASNHPARLRKLHELPGSAVFLDEAHSALPLELWPQTWLWLSELAAAWRCHFVFGSGSLTRYWELGRLIPSAESVPDLLALDLRRELLEAETERTRIAAKEDPLNLADLADFVLTLAGPRLVILNTVQSAAVLADYFRNSLHVDVLHLSTALAPRHRKTMVGRIEARLHYGSDRDWTLVATSCVEAGLDFSFRSGVRERCSFTSLIQAGGRVNRNGGDQPGELYDVQLRDPLFNEHPAFRHSRRVLEEMFVGGFEKRDRAEAATEALLKEIRIGGIPERAEELQRFERLEKYPDVAALYRVIAGDTRVVVVEPQLVAALEHGERVTSRLLLAGSVQVYATRIRDLAIQPLKRHPELFVWNAPYSPDFLGIMQGILPLVKARPTGYLSV